MSQYYRAQRSKNIYEPLRHGSGQANSGEPYRLSRSKLDLYLNCPRCFYLDRRLGVGRPPGYPFNLNSAVDTLLKKEFDIHRAAGSSHPLMEAYGLDAVPFYHENIEEWRDSLRRGITYHLPDTNILITGGVDDVWVKQRGESFDVAQDELIIVDYKATSKEEEVSLDADWQIGYKRQMEIYQWLFRMNGFKVSKTGYFVYCNGKTDREAFDGKLEFDIKLIPYEGDDSWVENTVQEVLECLRSDQIPAPAQDCDYCAYRESARGAECFRPGD